MKILWFPRLISGFDDLHFTTWREMGEFLSRDGNDIKIAVAGFKRIPDAGRYININILNKKILRLLSFWITGFINFLKLFFKYKPDAVIFDVYTLWFNLFFNWPGIKTIYILDNRTPIIHNSGSSSSSISNFLKSLYVYAAIRYSKCFMKGVTVITDYYKDSLIKEYGFEPKKIAVWSSGVDIEKFNPQIIINRSRPDYLKKKFVVMQHGELSFNRGLIETVKAINLIDNKDIVLLLVGSGPATGHIKEKIKKYGLGSRIYLIPPVSFEEIPSFISFADCAVMAYPECDYWNKNNPIKLIEYLAMGKVIICTDIWTFKDVADKSSCIRYISNNSPEEIADAICYLYGRQEDLLSWGKKGIDIVKERFTWEKQAEILNNFILSCKK